MTEQGIPMHTFSDEEFEDIVVRALDSMPERFMEACENIAFVVLDEPGDLDASDEGDWKEAYDDGTGDTGYGDGDILGLYDGIPLSERGDSYGFGEQPDVIYLFKGPHERLEGTREEIIEQVRRTVVHEIGHYFGMDEEQIATMGYE
jgi:predicted Zn-dependent protease with MMP-like domain